MENKNTEIGYFLMVDYGYANAAVFDSTGKRLAYIECKSIGALEVMVSAQFGDIGEITDKAGRIHFAGSFTVTKGKWGKMVNKSN